MRYKCLFAAGLISLFIFQIINKKKIENTALENTTRIKQLEEKW